MINKFYIYKHEDNKDKLVQIIRFANTGFIVVQDEQDNKFVAKNFELFETDIKFKKTKKDFSKEHQK